VTRQALVIGLAADTSVEHAKMIKEGVQELYPGLDVLVIAGCTHLAVVDLPEQSS
jgi:hypothetical protein